MHSHRLSKEKVFPGQVFEVEVVAIGRQNGITPGIVASTIISKHDSTISGGSRGQKEVLSTTVFKEREMKI